MKMAKMKEEAMYVPEEVNEAFACGSESEKFRNHTRVQYVAAVETQNDP